MDAATKEMVKELVSGFKTAIVESQRELMAELEKRLPVASSSNAVVATPVPSATSSAISTPNPLENGPVSALLVAVAHVLWLFDPHALLLMNNDKFLKTRSGWLDRIAVVVAQLNDKDVANAARAIADAQQALEAKSSASANYDAMFNFYGTYTVKMLKNYNNTKSQIKLAIKQQTFTDAELTEILKKKMWPLSVAGVKASTWTELGYML